MCARDPRRIRIQGLVRSKWLTQYAANGVIESPYLPDVGVLAFVPDRWEGVWQPRHQVLARLARYFHVVWVTPPIWWRNRLRDSPWRTEAFDTATAMAPGFSIFRPPSWLPEVGRPAVLARWTTDARLRRARGMLEARGCTKTIVYIWRPSFGGFLDLVPHDLSCYHIDDEYSFSDVEQPLDPNEARLIRGGGSSLHSLSGSAEQEGAPERTHRLCSQRGRLRSLRHATERACGSGSDSTSPDRICRPHQATAGSGAASDPCPTASAVVVRARWSRREPRAVRRHHARAVRDAQRSPTGTEASARSFPRTHSIWTSACCATRSTTIPSSSTR